MDNNEACALMIVRTDGWPNGYQDVRLNNENDFIFGLPFFFTFDVEFGSTSSYIAFYNKDP